VLADDEGRVVAMRHNSGTRAGKRLDVDWCIVFEIKDGRCIDGREYFFDLHAWDEFWSVAMLGARRRSRTPLTPKAAPTIVETPQLRGFGSLEPDGREPKGEHHERPMQQQRRGTWQE